MHQKNKKHKKCSFSDLPDDSCTTIDVKSEISEDQSQTDVPNDTVILGSSHGNDGDTSPDEQVQQNAQSSYSSQPARENPSLIPIPSSPVALGQWQHSQYPQHGCNLHELLERQPAQPIPQLTMPFWMPQHPSHQFPGASLPAFYQPILPGGTTDATAPGAGPSFYPGYPYPGFLGPWDHSSWLSHLNHSMPPPSSAFQGSFNRFSNSQPKTSDGQSAFTSSIQKGIIRPHAELSLEHQQLWEAQSLQNVLLWNTVGELQSELAEYKCRMKRLEMDSETLKPALKEARNHGTGACLGEKTSKTKTPEKLVSSNGVLLSSWPAVRNQKPGLRKAQSGTRQLHFEKVILKKVDYEFSTEQKTDGKVDAKTTNCQERKRSSGCSAAIDSTHDGCAASTVLNGKASPETLIESKSEDTMIGDSITCVIASQQVDRNGTISSSKNYVELINNLLMKNEQQEMEDGRSSGANGAA